MQSVECFCLCQDIRGKMKRETTRKMDRRSKICFECVFSETRSAQKTSDQRRSGKIVTRTQAAI